MGRVVTTALLLLTAIALLGLSNAAAAPAVKTPPMVLDKKTGHYKDLSYEALSDEGLSWEQRTRLFGGETAHYGPLTAEQRKAKQKELEALLAKIDMKLVNQCEADIRAWLDKLAARPLKNADWKKDWTHYTRPAMGPLSCGSAALFRAYEIWGDEKYLKAGLKLADVFVRDQEPRGNWRGNVCRIQDGFQSVPFMTVLYAYKVSGDKKYFESAKRCADLLLPLQRSSGGWPDQWCFDGARAGSSGIINGMSHNDAATIAPLRMMVIMYHMTGDKKYVANLHKLGPFIAKTNLGEGKVVGWAEGYDDNCRPLRVRQYEFELPYPKALTRSVGPLLIWLYLMDGDEAHMELLKRAYAWFEHVRKKELEPWQLEAWKVMAEKWPTKWGPLYYKPGWPDAYLPDGSNWGRGLYYKLLPWYPVTPEMKKKYGGLIHSSETDAGSTPGKIGYLKDWAEAARSGGKIPVDRIGGLTHSSYGNALSEVRRALLEHKRGGHKGLLKYYTNPVKYTPDQYLQARVDAAKRALDARNVRLAAMRDKGMNSMDVDGATNLFGPKYSWYGPKNTKWGEAYDDRIMNPRFPVHTAWYQWQLVYDTMLVRGKIDADAAARGGRGLQGIASMTHLDSWDVLGEYLMACHEKENHFDVPVGGKQAKEVPTKKGRRGRILLLGQDSAWYAGKEAVRIADNMLAYQRNNGGFPERWPGIDYTRVLNEKQKAGIRAGKKHTDSSFDNGTTHTQLRYLARAAAATKLERLKAAFVKGVDYLLAAQQPSGGWQQSWPHALYGGYARHITFNDGAMIGAMTVLRNVAEKKPDYAFVDEKRRAKAAEAVKKGIACILKCQIVVDGKPTVWCQQHDVKTFEPRGARSFEPPALCSWESVEIVQFLMRIDRPSPEVIAAIQNAIAWYDKVKIVGKERVAKRDAQGRTIDVVIVDNPKAPPQWARFYHCGTLGPWPLGVPEIKHNQPIFIDVNKRTGFRGAGKVYDTLAAISLERRKGYNYMGPYANKLLNEDYPAWQEKWAPGRNVLRAAAPAAEEMYLVRDGKPIEKNMVQADIDPASGWTQRKGKTVDGVFCPDLRDKNTWYWPANKSALGDCEFSVTFAIHRNECKPRAYSGPRGPKILLADRGAFGFWGNGSHVVLGGKKQSLPLKDFGMKTPADMYDGKPHTLSAKRVGDVLAFSLDGKKLNEQKIDPEADLIFALNPEESRPRITSMKLTAERFSDNLKTAFKTAAPIAMLFEGLGRPTTEAGKACAYRIPALLVTKKGTVLAFAEARRDSGRDNCDIDIVLKRSSDNGKTWGPEIKALDQGRVTSGNPCPVVLESGRILLLTCWNAHGGGEAGRRVFVTHSDDDGKTWSKPREITRQAKRSNWHWYATGPGAGGIQLTRGKHKGRVIIPCDTSVGRTYYSHIIYSDDNGENWKIGAVSPVGLNECQAVELANGDVMINSRNHRHASHFRGVCVSHDGGETFDPKLFRRDKMLVEPHCQASLRRYSWPEGDKPGIILYSGPGLATSRAQGTLRASYDEGKTWPWKQQYYQGPSGYSDIGILPDGRVAILFEKDGKSKLGFTILPAPPAAPPGEAGR